MKRKRISMLTGIAAGVACIMLLASTAFATALGGRWIYNPTYYISESNAYYTPIVSAASTWNGSLASTGTSIRILKSTLTSAKISVLTSDFGTTSWNAMGEPGPNPYSGTYTYATIKLNTHWMNSYSAEKKKAICTHEFGHILGLAHNTYSTPRTLMYEAGSGVYYDQWGISSPTYMDVQNLGSIYD